MFHSQLFFVLANAAKYLLNLNICKKNKNRCAVTSQVLKKVKKTVVWSRKRLHLEFSRISEKYDSCLLQSARDYVKLFRPSAIRAFAKVSKTSGKHGNSSSKFERQQINARLIWLSPISTILTCAGSYAVFIAYGKLALSKNSIGRIMECFDLAVNFISFFNFGV